MADDTDPIYRLARQRVVRVSAELEAQLAAMPSGGPCVVILRILQQRAAESLSALAVCDCTSVKEVILLQNEVKRYDEWFGAMKDLLADGKRFDQEMDEDERTSLLEYLMATEQGQREAVALGLIDPIPQDA